MMNNSDLLIGIYEQVVGTVYPQSDYAWAGLACPIDSEPSKVEFEITVRSYGITPVSKLAQKEYIPLEVVGVSVQEEEFIGNTYIGEVANNNKYELSGAAVCVIYRDEKGSMLGGDITFTDLVKPGRKAPFSLSPMWKAQAADYELYAVPW